MEELQKKRKELWKLEEYVAEWTEQTEWVKMLTTVEDAVQKVMDEAKAFAYVPENLCTITEKCYSEEMLHDCMKHWKKFDWDKTLTDQETFVERHDDFLSVILNSVAL